MNHHETVSAVARKLRQFSRRDVRQMLEVLIEVWSEELIQPGGYIRIEGLGKLYVEQQTIPITGVIKRSLESKQKATPTTLNRYYFRFRPVDPLYKKLKAYRETMEEQNK